MAANWETARQLVQQYGDSANQCQAQAAEARHNAGQCPPGPGRDSYLEAAEQAERLQREYEAKMREAQLAYERAYAERVEELKRQREEARQLDGPEDRGHSY